MCLLARAQSTLYVKTKDGTQTGYTLSGIKKLSFPAGSVAVTKTSGTQQSYALSTVRYLSFADYKTDAPEVEMQKGGNLRLYPNPATNSINIAYSFAEGEQAEVTILDIEGRELIRTTITHSVETRHALSLPLGNLQSGIYLCKVQNGKELATQVFVKQ